MRHPINKFIYFEELMKILTMMVHQYLVWPPPTIVTAGIFLCMDLLRELRHFGVMAPQTERNFLDSILQCGLLFSLQML